MDNILDFFQFIRAVTDHAPSSPVSPDLALVTPLEPLPADSQLHRLGAFHHRRPIEAVQAL